VTGKRARRAKGLPSPIGEKSVHAGPQLAGRRLNLIPHTVDEQYVFRFEFGPALLAQVLEKLQQLTPIAIDELPPESKRYPGFYQLFRNQESVYIGRTTRPIARRIREHIGKLRGRVPESEMTVRYVFVEDLSLVGVSEDTLIEYFSPLGLDPWATTGFGSKTPGYKRARQRSKWHAEFIPDLTTPVVAGNPRPRSLRQLIRSIGNGAPITVSVPREHVSRFDSDHPDAFHQAREEKPFGEWIAEVEKLLNSRWTIRREPMGWYVVPMEDAPTP
jgi:hypothetical protein